MGKYFIDEFYWALENGFGNSWAPINGDDTHQGFNPCHGDITIPKPKYETQVEYDTRSLDPDPDLSFTKDLIPGSGAFPGGDGMTYRDAFLLACIFTHKTVTGTWSGGAATYGQITGDFTLEDDKSSIMIQAGMTDKTTPIGRCYNGTVLTAYMLGWKKGMVLKESVELGIAYFQPNTQAFVPDSNFDDGKWSLWALKGAPTKLYHATGMKVYWDNAHTAELTHLSIEECQMRIGIPHDMEADSSDLKHQHEWNKKRTHECAVSGIITGNTEYEEAEKIFSSKTKKDLRMSWDQTTNEEKWLQIDDAWIEDHGTEILPHVENARRITLKFLGPTSRFENNYENLPDPSSRIDVSP